MKRAIIKNEEFVRVVCHNPEGGEEIYKDYFAFPQVDKVDKIIKNLGNRAVSVLVIGVDAVSRLNLYRQMPQVITFLKEKAIIFEMLGYNKVGDNTFPNLVPVLSGLSEKELKKKCWKSLKSVFDECPFIWKEYKKLGYYTAFAEDSANIGLFNYMKNGFRKQPTDFYGQIFNLLAEHELGHDKRLNTKICIGKRLNLLMLLDVIQKFCLRLKNYLSFSFFWSTSLSHDYLNLPYYGDMPYLLLFKTLYEEGIFEKSVIVFMSDHGIRWGGIRQTYQGYIEERLPFLFIMLPKWFVKAFPSAVKNLRTNGRRLTTPFDLHETLKDLTNIKNIRDDVIMLRGLQKEKQRGISLFLRIPEERTCDDAGISDNWCTCHISRPVKTDDPLVISAVNDIVNHINDMLKSYTQCATLKLQKILNARVEEVPINKKEDSDLKLKQLTDYSVSLETVPGAGQFEATVRYNNATKHLIVMDPISRINTYGNQSICISHYSLKLYCYCHNIWGQGL